MENFLLGIAIFLLLNIITGMARLIKGPSQADRMLAIQLFGSTGAAILVVLGKTYDIIELYNISLVFVLLAALAILTFTRRYENRKEEISEEL